MKISLYQFSPLWEDKKGNQQKIIKLLENSNLDTDVLVFPEMTLTGFTMRSNRFSEQITGETTDFFQSLAKQYSIHIFTGFIEESNGNKVNSLIHVNREGGIEAKYHKIHPFSISGENRHYSPGNNPAITTVDGITFGMSICYDLRFPELYRLYGKKRVSVIINIANWPVPRIGHYVHLLKARAIENQCYAIGVNRVGTDKGNTYNGRSAVFDPLGEEIALMNDEEKILTTKIDTEYIEKVRKQLPFLDDIRLI